MKVKCLEEMKPFWNLQKAPYRLVVVMITWFLSWSLWSTGFLSLFRLAEAASEALAKALKQWKSEKQMLQVGSRWSDQELSPPQLQMTQGWAEGPWGEAYSCCDNYLFRPRMTVCRENALVPSVSNELTLRLYSQPPAKDISSPQGKGRRTETSKKQHDSIPSPLLPSPSQTSLCRKEQRSKRQVYVGEAWLGAYPTPSLPFLLSNGGTKCMLSYSKYMEFYLVLPQF